MLNYYKKIVLNQKKTENVTQLINLNLKSLDVGKEYQSLKWTNYLTDRIEDIAYDETRLCPVLVSSKAVNSLPFENVFFSSNFIKVDGFTQYSSKEATSRAMASGFACIKTKSGVYF